MKDWIASCQLIWAVTVQVLSFLYKAKEVNLQRARRSKFQSQCHKYRPSETRHFTGKFVWIHNSEMQLQTIAFTHSLEQDYDRYNTLLLIYKVFNSGNTEAEKKYVYIATGNILSSLRNDNHVFPDFHW
jgi:hypothetical protein